MRRTLVLLLAAMSITTLVGCKWVPSFASNAARLAGSAVIAGSVHVSWDMACDTHGTTQATIAVSGLNSGEKIDVFQGTEPDDRPGLGAGERADEAGKFTSDWIAVKKDKRIIVRAKNESVITDGLSC